MSLRTPGDTMESGSARRIRPALAELRLPEQIESHSLCRYHVTAPSGPHFDALRDRYVVERELGRGGMATVYLARDLKHDRLVALKVLHSDLAQALGPERFLREVRIAAHLQHPHILTLIDSGEISPERENGPRALFYVMPYVDGETLRERLRREGKLLPGDATGSCVRFSMRWRMRTGPAWCTVTSNQRTSCSRDATRW